MGSVPLDVEPLDFILFKDWFDYNKRHPIRGKHFKNLVVRAYRDWKPLVHINNKIVKKRATEVWPWPENMERWCKQWPRFRRRGLHPQARRKMPPGTD